MYPLASDENTHLSVESRSFMSTEVLFKCQCNNYKNDII